MPAERGRALTLARLCGEEVAQPFVLFPARVRVSVSARGANSQHPAPDEGVWDCVGAGGWLVFMLAGP